MKTHPRVHRVLLFAASLAAGVALAASPADDALVGQWSGEAGLPTDRVTIAFEFERNDAGELVARVYQPVSNMYGAALPGKLEREGDRIVVKALTMSLAQKGDTLEGTLTSLGLPITLRRTQTLPSEVPVADVSQGPGPRWRVKLGAPIYAAAALRDGVAYVGTSGGVFQAVRNGGQVIFGSLDGKVYAVDAKSGTLAWTRDLRAPVTTVPALIGDELVVGTRGSVLYALRPASGETIWRDLFWGSWVESEAVSGNDVLYIGSSDLRRVSAIDPRDGRVAWRTDVFGCPWGRPALTARRVYVGAVGTDPYGVRHVGGVVALDRDGGRIAWRWPAPAMAGALQTGFAAAPAIDGNTLVIGGLDGTLYAFAVD